MKKLCLLIIVGGVAAFFYTTPCNAQVYGDTSSVRGFQQFRYGVGIGSSPLNTFRAYSTGVPDYTNVARTSPNPLGYSLRTPVNPVARTSHNRSMRIGLPFGQPRNQRITGTMPSLSALASKDPTITPFASLEGITSIVEQTQQKTSSLGYWRNWSLTSLMKPLVAARSFFSTQNSRLRKSQSILAQQPLAETRGNLQQTTSTFSRPNLGLGQTRLIVAR